MRKPRLMVVILDSMRELQADLDLFPQKDRAARLRTLAMVGGRGNAGRGRPCNRRDSIGGSQSE